MKEAVPECIARSLLGEKCKMTCESTQYHYVCYIKAIYAVRVRDQTADKTYINYHNNSQVIQVHQLTCEAKSLFCFVKCFLFVKIHN